MIWFLIWWVSGVIGGAYWWTVEEDLTLDSIALLGIVSTICGPLMWLVGWGACGVGMRLKRGR